MMDLSDKAVIGWDIGGVQTKCAALGPGGIPAGKGCIPLEVWKGPDELDQVLQILAMESNLSGEAIMAVTMTAELCDCFRTKRDGVLFVLDSFRRSFPSSTVWCISGSGEWKPLEEALGSPVHFAATNWRAAASWLARKFDSGLWVDIGTTTTDIIPLIDGVPATVGSTDTERLAHGELVYTGAIRSNPNTLTNRVPLRGSMCRVADERFSSMGDCHLILGDVGTSSYTAPTCDGRPADVPHAHARLARLACSDSESVDMHGATLMAVYLRERQILTIMEAMLQVCSRFSFPLPVICTGAGEFLAAEAARRIGLREMGLSGIIPAGYGTHLPAYAAAAELLLAAEEGILK
mgnify:CR=1 FL=1